MMLYPKKIKDPQAALDYKFTWGQVHLDDPPWLQPGETIQSETITVSPSGLNVDEVDITDSARSVTVWLSGGTANTTYTVRCRVVTSASRTDVRSMSVFCTDR